MATHFLTHASVIACGKASAPDCSADAEKVTCKNCLRSQAFAQRAPAPVASAPAPAPVAVETASKPALSVVAPVASGKSATKDARKAKHADHKPAKGVAFAEWRQRFSANDRLPRGKAFASM